MSYKVPSELIERMTLLPFTSVLVLRRNAVSDATLYSLLTQNEKIRYREIPESKKSNWLLGRGVGKSVIHAHLRSFRAVAIQPHEIEIVGMDGGQPTFNVCHTELETSSMHLLYCFSLSHTEGVAVAQISDRHATRGVGIDIEAIRTFPEETSKNFLTSAEYHHCMGHDEAKTKFMITLHWCLKEAYLKALGTGLRIHPRRISVMNIDEGGEAVLKLSGHCAQKAYWTMTHDLYIIASICL